MSPGFLVCRGSGPPGAQGSTGWSYQAASSPVGSAGTVAAALFNVPENVLDSGTQMRAESEFTYVLGRGVSKPSA